MIMRQIYKIYKLSLPFNKAKVTNFAKGGNSTASLCDIGYFPPGIHVFFSFLKLRFYGLHF